MATSRNLKWPQFSTPVGNSAAQRPAATLHTISHRASPVPPGVEGPLLRGAPRLVVTLAVAEVVAMQAAAAVVGAIQTAAAVEAAQAVEAVVVAAAAVAATMVAGEAEAWVVVEAAVEQEAEEVRAAVAVAGRTRLLDTVDAPHQGATKCPAGERMPLDAPLGKWNISSSRRQLSRRDGLQDARCQ